MLHICLLIMFQGLFTAGEGKVGTDEEKFVSILGTRSIEHLRKGKCVCVCVCLRISNNNNSLLVMQLLLSSVVLSTLLL